MFELNESGQPPLDSRSASVGISDLSPVQGWVLGSSLGNGDFNGENGFRVPSLDGTDLYTGAAFAKTDPNLAEIDRYLIFDGAATASIEPGSPGGETVKQSIQRIDSRSNGYVEKFNARLRDVRLNGGIFCSLKEARIVIEQRRRHSNQVRPHGSRGRPPPAPEAHIPIDPPGAVH